MNLHPDVLIYLQTVKNYLENNIEAKKYFIGRNDEDAFYDLIKDIANVNYEKNREPKLTREQFELVRITLQEFTDAEKKDDSIYEYIPNYIKFYLK